MGIHFTQKQLDAALDAHEAWWAGTLGRPLIAATVDAYDPGASGCGPLLSQANCADLQRPAEDIIEAADRELSRYEYLGDAAPTMRFDTFGPGVLSAFCSARLDNRTGSVWFFPDEEKPIDEIHITYDPNNIWVQRIKDIYRAGIRKWGNLVTMSMPDLGGVMDVVAVFRGSENLLMDLIDEPEQVLRVAKEVETAWRAAYEDLSQVLRSAGIAYTDWSGLLSRSPSYIIQCDFSYMIGNKMFREFVLPTLQRDCDYLSHSIYHLDGIGELNHLDDIAKIPELNAIQWVYGDGQPSARHWPEVYRRIADADKRIWLVGDDEDFRAIKNQGLKGIAHLTSYSRERQEEAGRLLAEYGVV